MLYPYIQHCLAEHLEIDTEGFLTWKTEHSKSDNFDLIFEIEKYFGTSLQLILSSLRAKCYNHQKLYSPVFSMS